MLFPALLLSLGTAAAPPAAGSAFDAAPFGQVWHWSKDGRDLGVFWEDSRDIYRVEVVFEEESPPFLWIEYWVSQWPRRRVPRDRLAGAGGSGWLDLGDWHRGRWQRAHIDAVRSAHTVTFSFRPLAEREFPQLADFSVRYRRTLKLRCVSNRPLPPVLHFRAFTDSTWATTEFQFLVPARESIRGRVEVFNGYLLSLAGETEGVSVTANDAFETRRARGGDHVLRGTLLYAVPKRLYCFDETVVTLRLAEKTFSFAVKDLLKEPFIFLPEYSFLVKRPPVATTRLEAERLWKQNLEKSIYARVFKAPQQTLKKAWADMPQKEPHDMPLSFPGTRQHFRIDQFGSLSCHTPWIRRIHGKDTEKCLWEGQTIRYKFGLPEKAVEKRTLARGCLPVLTGTWREGGATFRQTAFAAPLKGVPHPEETVAADDTMVCFVRLEIESAEKSFLLPLSVADGKGPQELSLEGDVLKGTYRGGSVSRLLLRAYRIEGAKKKRLTPKAQKGASGLALRCELPQGGRITVDFLIPFVTLGTEEERRLLRNLHFDAVRRSVTEYWETQLRKSSEIVTPQPMINDFYRAYLTHVLINTEREAGSRNRYMAKVGTFYYGVYSNESCMMISELDRRGFFSRAEGALKTFLHYQGTVPLPGDFATKDGVFYGAGGYEAGGYNQHHGWVLWALGEHYFLSGNREWLSEAAPHIVRGIEWVVRERARTRRIAQACPIRRIESGLLPQGRLEDIGDWRSWLSTNVYTWWSMKRAVEALGEAGHPEAPRLKKETEQYGRDILQAFTEARYRSPVVKLRDGSFVPHVPSEVHRRGRCFGWITETLEGAIHLVRCALVPPTSLLATWIMKDYEDNLYLSHQFGYLLEGKEFERYWFSRGGISMQAHLLPSPIPYLLRDEVKHFLRAYFNSFAASYFPDTRMMTEHALPEIGNWRGDHFKASDEANSCYFLRLMFVREEGEVLWLGQAVPRSWFEARRPFGIRNAWTSFGVLSLTFKGSRNRIDVQLTPPGRRQPKRIILRVRAPSRRPPSEIRTAVPFRFEPEKEQIVFQAPPGPCTFTFFYK